MSILAISIPVTAAREEALGNIETRKTGENGENKDENLGTKLIQVPCIRYPIIFWKQSVSALLNLGNKVNVIYLTFAKKLGLSIRLTDIKVQKIDGTTLYTYEIIVAAFLVTNKVN